MTTAGGLPLQDMTPVADRHVADAPRAQTDSDPVFLYGALRSGTTMLRLMLNGHGRISNPGEADFLFDWIRPDASHPTGWRYDLAGLAADRIFRDKALEIPPGCDGRDLLVELCRQLAALSPGILTLNVHRHADRLAALLPEARVIHFVRDPRDVARSVIGMGWAGTLYHGVEPWRQTEAGWERIAARLGPDRVFDLRYEELLANPEPTLARLCDFLGVAYDPEMLEFHKTSTYGTPDPGLAEQWRSRSSAQDIALVEGKVGALMTARGYDLSGPGRRPGRAEAAVLWMRNKAAVWRFGMRRYGAGLYWGEKLTRWLGISGRHAAISARMRTIAIRHLK